MSCPDRLSQWSQEVSTAFGHLSKPQMWGLMLWSAGIALSGVAGITQISASRRLGAGTAGTNGVPTLARVVSGRETQKREKAAGTGCDLVLCTFVAVDRASVGKREPTTGAGFGCDNIGRALDNFIHQRGGVQVCDPGGMEGLRRA